MARIDILKLVGISGTNKVMAGELSRLARRALDGYRIEQPKKEGLGTLNYSFDSQLASVALAYHRTCSRVLWGLYESRARRLEPLYDELRTDIEAENPLERGWLFDGARISVQARNVKNFAAGERQIVGTVKNAIFDAADRFGIGLEIDPQEPDVSLVVRMHDDVLSLSVDLAGRAMHQRGYRRDTGDAPLRENLAAVLVMLGRFDARRDVFIDPMAGSGTIAIEAALMSRASHLWRGEEQPAAHLLPAFEKRPHLPAALFADSSPLILASDIDSRAIEMIEDNAEAAGVGDLVRAAHLDARHLTPKIVAKQLPGASERETGLILSNPPYGERLSGGELDLYADLGEACRAFPGYRAAFLVGNPDFEEAFGERARVKKPLSNGSIRSYFYMYDL